MKYKDKIRKRCEKAGNSICMGMDPILKKIPLKGNPEYQIKKFYSEILNGMIKRKIYPAAVKPNIAFYEGISIECLSVLQELIKEYRGEGMTVILDAKRGDIGKTSEAYAHMAFDVYAADAVTVNPYMGHDSVSPFQKISEEQGIYVLVRTSNPSAADFEDLKLEVGGPLYMEVARKLSQWNEGNLGAVVGATSPDEMNKLLVFWQSHGGEIPCLIPGVSLPGVAGGQGGSAKEVANIIRQTGCNLNYHLINSSSGLNYAHETSGSKYPEATCNALEDMIEEMAG